MRLVRSLIVFAACGLALLPFGTASAKFVPPKLNYIAITPCRIIDTRPVGGPFAAKETRNYSLNGGATQGGTGCTVYSGANAPFAVAVNVTVDATALGSPSVRLHRAVAAESHRDELDEFRGRPDHRERGRRDR